MARAWLGILMIALISGMIGCRGEGNIESFLNGTWRANTREYYQDQRNQVKSNIADYDYKITFTEGISVYEGIFEESIGDIPVCKGIYAVNGRDLAIRVTHIYGIYLGCDPEWYLIKNEDEDGFEIAFIKEYFYSFPLPFNLSLVLLPQSYTCSIGTTLEMTTTVVETPPYSVTTKYRRIREIEDIE